MGMFDQSYVNLPPMEQASGFGDTNAFMIGAQAGTQGMFQGLGKLMGFQDEEDLLMEIYNTSDLTTPQGRKEAIDRIRQVNPEAADELQQQILNSANAEAAIQNTEMNTEKVKLERATLLFGPAIQREFETDVSVNGKRAAIQAFLTYEGIEFDPKKINTQLDAIQLINKTYGKSASGPYLSGMKEYVGSRQSAYVQQRVMEQAGLAYQGSATSSQTPTGLELPALDDGGSTTTTSEEFAKSKGNYNENDSAFSKSVKEGGYMQQIRGSIERVRGALIDFKPEVFMKKDELAVENAEDAIGQWLGGQVGYSSATEWFKERPESELLKFEADPVAYYKANGSAIEGSTTYASDLDNNEDLFASIPY